MVSKIRKIIQKRVYDILSHKYGTLIVFIGLIVVIVSAFHFGEALIEWSHEKYATVFNSYSDNIVSKSFRKRLCLPVPIDVVYTWVNGTDPALLDQLNKIRYEMKEEMTSTKETKCQFHNCVPSNMVVLDPVLSEDISLFKLKTMNKLFLQANKMFTVRTSSHRNLTFTMVELNQHAVENITSVNIVLNGRNTTISRVYYTSDSTKHYSILSEDTILMSGFPHSLTSAQLKDKLPAKFHTSVTNIDINTDTGVAVLTVLDKAQFTQLTQLKNCSIDSKTATFNAVNYIWDLRDFSRDDDIASSRFEDNEELRYSMRSLVRYAPWIRHIYIVTNGQIPYWLNMDNSRITVVTHEELFPNKSHLPTFSSPAIEAHLHRIEGLSDKYIYMNDDVLFGKEVWPDDFFSQSSGHKVYLTWPVPNCNDGCPSNWIKDGYCDKACNTTECDWDGGDCEGKIGNVHLGAGFHAGYDSQSFAVYCNVGCANTWIADRYCDTACNVKKCGFDAGDCGTNNYDKLYGLILKKERLFYTIPVGIREIYFNLTGVFGEDGYITSALYNSSNIIRQVAVSNKFKVLTIVLQSGHNETLLVLSLHGHTGIKTETLSHNFTVTVDTSVVLKEIESNVTKSNKTTIEEEEEIVIIPELTDTQRRPQIKTSVDSGDLFIKVEQDFNSNNTQLPVDIISKLQMLEAELNKGFLTQKGFQRQLQKLWKSFSTNKQNRKNDSILRKLLWLDRKSDDLNDQWYLNRSKGIDYQSGFPWEKKGFISEIKVISETNDYVTQPFYGRKLLDTFGDSLRHVNKIYNKAFGFDSRKVPAHMPHMIDKNIMADLQERFPADWNETSSHKIRHSRDMQYSFSFFYYLMGVTVDQKAEDIFRQIDTDHSGVLSDREIRNLAAKLYDLPLYLELLTGLENLFVNCTQLLPPETIDLGVTEVYYDKSMPQVTRNMFLKCEPFLELLQEKFKPQKKYKFTILDDNEVAFKMIKTNVSGVVGQLDDIRRNPKKFICINDNIEHGSEGAKTVKAILQDFYESMFPEVSDFELPREYRNRFLHIHELREWRTYRDRLRFWTHVALILLIIITIATYFGDKIEEVCKKYRRHSKHRRKNSSLSSYNTQNSSIINV